MKIIKNGFIIPTFLEPYFEPWPEETLINWAQTQFAGDTFIDIGAHVGTWSTLLSSNFKRIISFEPQRDIYNCLCGSIALKNSSSKTITHNVALSDSPGESELRYNTEGGGEASLVINGALSEKVSVHRLDSYDIKDIGLIKIDVEGNEYNVIKGGVKTLIQNNFPPILFESWADERGQRKDELLDLFTELGYTVSSINCFPEMHLAKR